MDLNQDVHMTLIDLLHQSQQTVVTPAYIYSVEQVVENYNDLKAALGTPLIVSIKANHCAELLARTAFSFDDGCEFASLGELRLRAGTRNKVYVNTPVYSKKLIEVASRYDAVFIIDHIAQLDVLGEFAAKGAFKCPVLLRINLDAAKGGVASSRDHFGMDTPGVFAAAHKALELGIEVAGLHVFCGSNGFVERSSNCIEVVEALFDEVSQVLGYPLTLINLGGGITTDWRERNIDFATYRQRIASLCARATVVHESGRAIFGSAGYFLAEVVSVKHVGDKHYLVCDGGIAQNFLLAHTEHVIRRHAAPTVLIKRFTNQPKDYLLVGSSCNRDDVIGELKNCLHDIQAGDRVMFRNCGAYNALYTMNKFLALPQSCEYIV